MSNNTDTSVKANVHFGTWNDTTRANPAMKWMENYTRHVVDAQSWGEETAQKYHTSDFTVQKPSGECLKGASAAWKAIEELYSPFQAFRHEPDFLVYWEYEGGKEWGMAGTADVWFRLHGLSGDAETDKEGGKWDGHNRGAFVFHYVQEGEEIRLKSTKIFADAGPAMKLMLNKGMIDAETLKGIVIGS